MNAVEAMTSQKMVRFSALKLTHSNVIIMHVPDDATEAEKKYLMDKGFQATRWVNKDGTRRWTRRAEDEG